MVDQPSYLPLVRKVWGYENIIVNNELYCGKILHINSGFRTSLHYHKKKDETFYVLSGIVLLQYGDDIRELKPGEKRRIPPMLKHRITGLTDSDIVEVSTTHHDEDSIRIEVGEKYEGNN